MVELLAPAGNIDCFYAAIAAGADAVYMAGDRFGARASATNFTEEEFIDCLHYAHICGKKIYLTFNTLIKEREWKDVYDFILPLYREGLDGIIIQDIGLIKYLSEAFPSLPLHASTQMTITDASSAELLKSLGICRIVPARELSIDEIVCLKKETGLEIETFVHGALCYSYSGQCLFSSFLGGRSGNRGRCAGPCRLPYSIVDGNGRKVATDIKYPLSLKDLCTIDYIPMLIEAGIDSFKIEGRMKSPEYVAGVTSVYRKYIDYYYENKSCDVSKKDREILMKLYLRSFVGCGYYKQHNGADMITAADPSYNCQDEKTVMDIRDRFLNEKYRIPVDMEAHMRVEEPMKLTVTLGDITVSADGGIVDAATKKSATFEDVKKQLSKLGNTSFCLGILDIDMGNDCFLPVSALNELRRDAIDKLESAILDKYKRTNAKRPECTISKSMDRQECRFIATVSTIEQMEALMNSPVDVICVSYDLFYNKTVDAKCIEECHRAGKLAYIALPRIMRLRDDKYFKKFAQDIEVLAADGLLVRNLEELSFVIKCGLKLPLMLDYTMYAWNKSSLSFYKQYGDVTAPLELSLHQIDDLEDKDMIVPVYGHTPLMVSANCVYKTTGSCISDNGIHSDIKLKDRMNKEHFVINNCVHCYNEIFNAVPTSLHKYMKDITKKYSGVRLDFTVETKEETKEIVRFFTGESNVCPIDEFTLGHIDKGAI